VAFEIPNMHENEVLHESESESIKMRCLCVTPLCKPEVSYLLQNASQNSNLSSNVRPRIPPTQALPQTLEPPLHIRHGIVRALPPLSLVSPVFVVDEQK
jgi:hypothetical protein